MMKTTQVDKTGKRRLLVPLFVALVVGFYSVCGLLYFFQFRDEIQKCWFSRNQQRQRQQGSQELKHSK